MTFDSHEQPEQDQIEPAPVTGQPEIDRATQAIEDLANRPLADHHDELARAHEVLHNALNPGQQFAE